jgi:integrase
LILSRRNPTSAAATTEKRPPGSIASGGKGAAAQCVALASSIYAFAIGRGLSANNPARRVKKAPVRKVERFLSEAEIARLAAALDAEAERTDNPYPAAAIKLLLLTGCRRGEIVNLRIPGVKTESGSAAIKVWPSARKTAELRGLRLRDLRHSFASVGAAGGLSLPIIGALLGHKHATTARYAHLSADPLRAANDAVGARIVAAMNRKPGADASAEVVALPSRTGEVHR